MAEKKFKLVKDEEGKMALVEVKPTIIKVEKPKQEIKVKPKSNKRRNKK